MSLAPHISFGGSSKRWTDLKRFSDSRKIKHDVCRLAIQSNPFSHQNDDVGKISPLKDLPQHMAEALIGAASFIKISNVYVTRSWQLPNY